MTQKSWTLEGKSLAGAGLVLLGLLFLLGGLGLSSVVGRFVGALLFGGLAYLAYEEGRRKGNQVLTLAAIPLVGLALASLLPGFGGGALFLAAVGLAFALVWRRNPTRWWAVIVAGTLGSAALTAALPRPFAAAGGALFLLGMAATFFALTRLRSHAQPWAIYPAGGLVVLAVLELVGGAGGWLVPAVLIGGGLYLLYRDGRLGPTRRPAAPYRGAAEPAAPADAARPLAAPEAPDSRPANGDAPAEGPS